jgi:hypothetical protein
LSQRDSMIVAKHEYVFSVMSESSSSSSSSFVLGRYSGGQSETPAACSLYASFFHPGKPPRSPTDEDELGRLGQYAKQIQARSAWSHEENCPVPGERLKGSRLRLEANKGWIFGLDPPDFDCPSGTGLSASLPRHFVPGYYHPVPPGQKPFAHRRPRIKLARMGR